MSDTIISKIDEMGKRIDDLEHSLQDVMQQSGAGGAQSNPQ
jgi:heat shock factor-binding protein 1